LLSVSFPKDFIWGTATSSYQIEGASFEDGKGKSIWDTFSHTPGKVLNGDTGDTACDHYHRYKEDVMHMKQLGLKSYRFSISWPRVFPEGRGKVNQKGLDFYKALVEELLKNGIQPMATLYHWDLPQALQDRGGWDNRDTIGYFTDYADTIFRSLGDRVSLWITHNEPFCTSMLGNYTGENAPGYNDPALAVRVSHNLLLSHAETVALYRQSNMKGKIGITLILYPVHPLTQIPGDINAARRMDGVINRWFLDPVLKGRYPEDILEIYESELNSPDIREGDMEKIASNSIDFLGVNYYTRMVVKYSENDPLLGYEEVIPEGAVRTGIGWEIYPEGLYEMLSRIHNEYGQPEIFITENGAAYDDKIVSDASGGDGHIHDPERIKYLERHLMEVNRAIKEGVNVKGYYLWSLLDNFEWDYGYSQRFGIIHVDYKTQERRWKSSAYWYRDVIDKNGLEY